MKNELNKDEDPQILFKQKVIQREIIDKNYNKNLFYTFCMNRKPNADDLSNWSLKELSVVINDFTETQGTIKKTKEEKDLFLQEIQKQSEEIKINLDKIKENKKIASVLSSSYLKEINCNKIQKSKLNDISPKVIIKDPKLIEGSMLSLNYITYEVQTTLVNWSVKRRYSDFEWLRMILVKYYPNIYVPPIPAKQIGSKRFESNFVRKRITFLQLFLDNLLQNELFKASEPLIVFLSENERLKFENKMKELSIFTPSNEIQNTLSLTGILLTTIDDEYNEIYQSNIDNYLYMNETVLERLDYNLKYFYKSISVAVQNLEEIQKDFETLFLLNSRVSMKEELTQSYEELALFFKNWKKILHNQNEIFSLNLRDFFEYIRMECTSYRDLVKTRKDIKELYTIENNKLLTKKEYQWTTMDITKCNISDEVMKTIDEALLYKDKRYAFEHMNTIETKIVENIYLKLCYSNRCNIDELKKMIDRYCFSYVNAIKKFTEELYPSLNDALSVWTNLANFIDTY